MIGPDGTIYPNRHRILSHDRPHRIVYLLDDGDGPHDDPPIARERLPDRRRDTVQTPPMDRRRRACCEEREGLGV